MSEPYRTFRKYLTVTSLINGVLGCITGGLLMKIAWDHNPQNEFFNSETGRIYWENWLAVGLGGFSVIFVPLTIISLLVLLLRLTISLRSNMKIDE